MHITYEKTKDFKPEDLKRLFLSVDWSSGHYPEKLVIGMRNFGSVFSAWDGDKLVGMVCVMDDGIMNAYIHYVLVDPEYQGQGIGKRLLDKVKMKYKDYVAQVERLSHCNGNGMNLSDYLKDNVHVWSNYACVGYCKIAMSNAGLDGATIEKVISELEAAFDDYSVDCAENHSSDVVDDDGMLVPF